MDSSFDFSRSFCDVQAPDPATLSKLTKMNRAPMRKGGRLLGAPRAKRRKTKGRGRGTSNDVVPRSLVPNGTSVVRRLRRWSATQTGMTLTGGALNSTMSFKLSQVAEYSDLTNSWQFFRIEEVIVHFLPAYTNWVAPTSTTQTPSCPMLAIGPDLVGAASTTWEDVCAREGSRIHLFNRPTSYRIRPVFEYTIYQSTTASTYGPGRGWIDASASGAPWYGIVFSVNTVWPSLVTSFFAGDTVVEYVIDVANLY